MAEKELQFSFGRIVTWFLSAVTTILVVVATCYADNIDAKMTDIQRDHKEYQVEISENRLNNAILEERYNTLLNLQSQTLAEVRSLRKEVRNAE